MWSRRFVATCLPFLLSFSSVALADVGGNAADPVPEPPHEALPPEQDPAPTPVTPDGGEPLDQVEPGACFGVLPEACDHDGAACGAGGVCLGGSCALLGASCGASSDCVTGASCFSLASACETSEQCDEGFQCQIGLCMRPQEGRPLNGGYPELECAEGDEACAPLPGRVPCDSNDQCAGFLCLDHYCVFPEREAPEVDEPVQTPLVDEEDADEEEVDAPIAVVAPAAEMPSEDTRGANDALSALQCSTGRTSSYGSLGFVLALGALLGRRRR